MQFSHLFVISIVRRAARVQASPLPQIQPSRLTVTARLCCHIGKALDAVIRNIPIGRSGRTLGSLEIALFFAPFTLRLPAVHAPFTGGDPLR
jgi:hypothetical protein